MAKALNFFNSECRNVKKDSLAMLRERIPEMKEHALVYIVLYSGS